MDPKYKYLAKRAGNSSRLEVNPETERRLCVMNFMAKGLCWAQAPPTQSVGTLVKKKQAGETL
jgi:hypothetical protein